MRNTLNCLSHGAHSFCFERTACHNKTSWMGGFHSSFPLTAFMGRECEVCLWLCTPSDSKASCEKCRNLTSFLSLAQMSSFSSQVWTGIGQHPDLSFLCIGETGATQQKECRELTKLNCLFTRGSRCKTPVSLALGMGISSWRMPTLGP